MYIEEYTSYLITEKKMAKNTVEAYKSDISEFIEFEKKRKNLNALEVSSTEIIAFLHELKTLGKSTATINRKLASLRAFFNFYIQKGKIHENPTINIKSPRIERKAVDYLELEEIDKLFSYVDESDKGVRNRAILEVLYATGVRASEIIEANVEDINLKMGFITCMGEQSRARIVPLGRPARKVLEKYIDKTRPTLIKDGEEEKALFVNYYGKRITRQGLWKVLKECGQQAGLEHSLTPNVLRNSFAVHMLQNGADLKSLQELMGYEDIAAIQIYLSVVKNRIKDVYDRTHPRA